MPTLHFTVDIEGPSETIFALLADITGYERWLPGSRLFGAITVTSEAPVGLGTTYIDTGPSGGAMHGTIIDYQPPRRIAFQQSMPVKVLLFAGKLDITTRYMLEPLGQATRVNREVSFHLPGVLNVAQPILASTVRRESQRILQQLKHYVETLPEHKDQ